MTTTPAGVYVAIGMPMSAETPKPNRETWRDWIAPGEPEPDDLLTRDELIDELRRQGYPVRPHDLQNWQSAGVIPYGVNRWHAGAVRTIYPIWMIDLLRLLKTLRKNGHNMGEIREMLRSTFRRRVVVNTTAGNLELGSTRATLVIRPPRAEATARAFPPAIEFREPIRGCGSAKITLDGSATAHVRRAEDAATLLPEETVAVAMSMAAPPGLAPRIAETAREAEQVFGRCFVRAEVRLVDEGGDVVVFRFDTPPAPES